MVIEADQAEVFVW